MCNAYRLLRAFSCAAACFLAPAAALGQAAYLLAGGNQLVRIDASAPGTIKRSVTVTGLLGDSLVAIDFRPLTGQLYGLGSGSRLYTINAHTGVAAQVGSGITFSLAGTAFGFDFNPLVDRIRLVSDADQNLRLNPDTAAISGLDTQVSYAPGDPNAGVNPSVAGSAYTNNFAGTTTTTLYGIDAALNALVLQTPPNNGTLTTLGPLGYDTTGVLGFDIRTAAGGQNTAYAALQVGGASSLFTINLSTGAATPIGNLPAGLSVAGLALAPSPFWPATDLNGDYRSDILYRNGSTGQVWRMLVDGFTVFGAQMAYTEPNLAWRIVADADFNGDGRGDLLWRNIDTGQVYVMTFGPDGLPAGGGVVYTEPNPAWEIVQATDLNGDGRADLVWANATTGQVYAVLLNGTSIVAQGLVYTEPNLDWSIVASGGMAGMGRRNQLVWHNAATGQVYLMSVAVSGSTFTTSGAIIYTEPNTSWRVVGAPDLDGDGVSDLVWRNVATGHVYGMLVNGGQITAESTLHVEGNLAWKIVAFGDYDGDGRADLLWRNESTGQVYMMRMNGLAIAAQGFVYTEPNVAWKVMGPYEYAQ